MNRSHHDWVPFSYEDLSGWASELSRVLEASRLQVAETERRGVFPGESLQVVFLMLRALRTQERHPSWRVWSDLATETALRVETQAAGSGRVFLETVSRTIVKCRSREDLTKACANLTRVLDQVVGSKEPLQEEEFYEWLRTFSRTTMNLSPERSDLVQAVIQALQASGPQTRIRVGVAAGSHTWHVVNQRGNGWGFSHGIQVQGLAGPWTRSECRVCLVDGIVETVASLDVLLQEAHDTKSPVLVVSRGMSEEVLATLATNLHNRRLDVVPVTLDPENLAAVNVLVDLATCTGAKVVSPLCGDLLSTIRLQDLAVVPRVQVVPRTDHHPQSMVSVENPARQGDVQTHTRYLYSRALAESQTVQELAEVFQHRLASLTSDTVEILLPGGLLSPTDLATTQTYIDTLLRTAKSVLAWGVVPPTTESGMGIAEPVGGFDAPSRTRTCLASFLGLSACKSLLGALARVSGLVTVNLGGF